MSVGRKVKKICNNCAYFEVMDIDGMFLDKGHCLLKDLYTFMEDDDTCDDFAVCKQRKKDIENGY